jgi:predicted DCC family thiol-disulfide oxidoreductase YuxK
MKIKVFFNNSCNICKLEIDHYKKNSDRELEWIDITNNQKALSLTSKTREELLRRLHVIEDGKVIGGAKAFIIIWSRIPKYKILSKIFSIKPLFLIFNFVYEIVAYFLFLKNKSQLK